MTAKGAVIRGDDEVRLRSPSLVALGHGWGNDNAKAGASPQLEGHASCPRGMDSGLLCARGIEPISIIRGMKNSSRGDRLNHTVHLGREEVGLPSPNSLNTSGGKTALDRVTEPKDKRIQADCGEP